VDLPMFDTVMKEIGKPIVFNICMLGTLIGLSGLIKPESILKVLETTIPKDFMDMNKKALELGMQMGESAE
jgi:2-oxoglutarate ferredoxin oxidoreductase subunit gamma